MRSIHILTFLLSALSVVLAAGCNTNQSRGTSAPTSTPLQTTPSHQLLEWPFVQSAGHQWAIVNGYGQGDHGQVRGSDFALDFGICSTITNSGGCDVSAGWDYASTDGQRVLSPVAGTVIYIDDTSGGGASPCRTIGIQVTVASNVYYVVQLAHVEQLRHYDMPNVPDIKLNDPVKQLEPIGVVSAQTGGGCLNQSHHIHMELYSGSDSQRQPQPFVEPWTIAGCPFKKTGSHEGEFVPCGSSSTTPTGAPHLDEVEAKVKVYYDTKGVWAGTYVLKQFLAVTLRSPSGSDDTICAAYVFADPSTPTKAEGVDIRTFQLQAGAGGWDVVAMGDHLSCSDVEHGPAVVDSAARQAIKLYYDTVRYAGSYVMYQILSATYTPETGFLNYLTTAHVHYQYALASSPNVVNGEDTQDFVLIWSDSHWVGVGGIK